MFKNLQIFRIGPAWVGDIQAVEAVLSKLPFAECGATQERSFGWVPPRGEEHGAMIESVGGQWIARMMFEARSVPASALARRVKEKAALVERETGRKPGKKEMKELKEEAKLDLLPKAFPKQGSVLVWIDPQARILVLDTTSQGRSDAVVSALAEALPGLSLSPINTQISPQTAMAIWLKEQVPPVGFSIDRECELKSDDESKSVVRYGRHPLDIEEVQAHIAAGKLPTKLAMTWDSRVSFLITTGLQVKKLAFLETVFAGKASEEAGFDADVAIATGELSKLIPDLIEAFGGEVELAQSAEHGDGAYAEHPEDDPTDAELYEQAVMVVRTNQKASVSLVQRHLRIGYNRAARLLEEMQSNGIVSAAKNDGSRLIIDAVEA